VLCGECGKPVTLAGDPNFGEPVPVFGYYFGGGGGGGGGFGGPSVYQLAGNLADRL
jgi:hypothetical protein